MNSAATIYRESFLAGLKADPALTVSQWADAYRFLSQKASSEPGRWRTDRTPYLREILDCLSSSNPIQRVVFMAGAQVGKALAIDTPIPTPDGWSEMGALQVGDFVFDAGGKPTRVIGVSNVFRGHDCFCVKFSDGAEIVADADHLWVVSDEPGKNYGKKTLTTREISGSFKVGDRNRYAIEVCGAIDCPEVDLPISPYVFGVWLGDGNSASAQITSHIDDCEIAEYIREAGHSVRIRKIDNRTKNVVNYIIDEKEKRARFCLRGHDTEIVGRMHRGTCKECHRQRSSNYQRGTPIDPLIENKRKSLGISLLRLGVLKNKHIPQKYLRASIEQRMELLRGLMDTDGHVTKRGRLEFCTASRRLAMDFNELIRSLGLKPTMSNCSAANAYRIGFMAYNDKPVFRLKRKKMRMLSTEGARTTETRRRRIVDVVKVESVPTRCILVDNERHLFLAGRAMIPTHNTECGNNWLGYIICHAPGATLIVQPTVDTAKRLSKQRLAPMIEETPVLRERISPSREKDSGNTMMVKEFLGGVLIITGANSAVGLRSMPVRYLFLDEIDAYPSDVDGEGDPVKLAERRTTTFSRKKIFMCSTPTIKDVSRIEREFLASDQRRFFVPCPHCENMDYMRWSNIKWEGEDAATTKLLCESCGALIEEHFKTSMLLKGEWRAMQPSNGKTAGYHLSSLYSPLGWKSWAEIVAEFLAARSDPPLLKEWVNTVLGETWEEEYSAKIGADGLAERAEDYEFLTVPQGGLLLTAGVDVQDNRIAIVVRAWGKDEESWLVNWTEIHGDPARPELWAQVDSVLLQEYSHESGSHLKVAATSVDSGGHFTHEVYAYCRARKNRHIIAIKGQSQAGKPAIGKPSRQDVNFKNQTIKKGVDLWPVGSDTIKTTIYSRLKNPAESGAGVYHFPLGVTAEYYKQLTAEKQITRYQNGFAKRVWMKKDGARNEALDCEVYAFAALQYLMTRVNRAKIWEQAEKNLQDRRTKAILPQIKPESPMEALVPKQKINTGRRRSFVKGW